MTVVAGLRERFTPAELPRVIDFTVEQMRALCVSYTEIELECEMGEAHVRKAILVEDVEHIIDRLLAVKEERVTQ